MAKKFDIHFQALSEEDQRSTFKFVTFGHNPAIGIKGFQMLINQWLKCFLTPRGSDPSDLLYGTDFTKLVGSNVPTMDARDISAIAIDECNTQVFSFQENDTTLTATERLASAEIVNFVEQPDVAGFSIYIELKNQANERATVALPVTSLTE
jgi:hypothetical protein